MTITTATSYLYRPFREMDASRSQLNLINAAQTILQMVVPSWNVLSGAMRYEEYRCLSQGIDSFGELLDNWDGYGASSISAQARNNALGFVRVIEAYPFAMPRPDILPKPTGTISFEWETAHAEAYIEIGNTRYSGFIKRGWQQPIFLQGQADAMDQQLVAVVQNSILPPPMHPAAITEIRTGKARYELLAA
jgi:hypothetical protein